MQQVDNFYTPPHAPASEQETVAFSFDKLLGGCYFIELAKVSAANGDGTVDVLPLVMQQDTAGNPIENAALYNIPVWQLQAGKSAIKMSPMVGDIGIIAICDKDITQVKIAKDQAAPTTRRRHSKSDAIYLGGVQMLNSSPTQYIEFIDGQPINVVAPNGFHVEGPITSSSTIVAQGDVTGGGISLVSHVHGGVESGASKTSTPE